MEILLNTFFVLALFFVLILIFHILFIKIFVLSEKKWLLLEYVILVIGTVSIVLLTTDLRALIMSGLYEQERGRTDMAYILLIDHVERLETCIRFVKSEFSPSNFDQIQKEYDDMCFWEKELLKRLPAPPLLDYPELKFVDYRPTFDIKESALIQVLEEVEKSFDYYNETRGRMFNYMNRISKNDFEDVLYFFSPYLLVAALALQFTKVTADRKLIKAN